MNDLEERIKILAVPNDMNVIDLLEKSFMQIQKF